MGKELENQIGPKKSSISYYLGILFLVVGILSFNFLKVRADFFQLILFFLVAFAGFFLIVKNRNEINSRHIIFLAIGLRIGLIFSPFCLSDDFYRYLWDGLLTLNGHSAYATAPTQEVSLSPLLLDKMNSPNYYSIYPPVAQLFFSIAAYGFKIGGEMGGVVTFRILVLMMETTTLAGLYLLAKQKEVELRNLVFYVLNPLVIIEFTMGIHVEFLMVCALTWGYYFLIRYKKSHQPHLLVWAGVLFAFSILTKFWPVFFMPLLWRELGLKRSFVMGLIVVIVIGLCYSIFYSPNMFEHIGESLSLYFKKFEFNQSLYFFAKHLNDNGANGVLTFHKLVTFGAIIWLYFQYIYLGRRTFFETCLLIMVIYFLNSAVVHPWYIASLSLFFVVKPYYFVLAWMFMIPLTYYTYVNEPVYVQNGWLILAEYVIVFAVMFFEWRKGGRNELDSL